MIKLILYLLIILATAPSLISSDRQQIKIFRCLEENNEDCSPLMGSENDTVYNIPKEILDIYEKQDKVVKISLDLGNLSLLNENDICSMSPELLTLIPTVHFQSVKPEYIAAGVKCWKDNLAIVRKLVTAVHHSKNLYSFYISIQEYNLPHSVLQIIAEFITITNKTNLQLLIGNEVSVIEYLEPINMFSSDSWKVLSSLSNIKLSPWFYYSKSVILWADAMVFHNYPLPMSQWNDNFIMRMKNILVGATSDDLSLLNPRNIKNKVQLLKLNLSTLQTRILFKNLYKYGGPSKIECKSLELIQINLLPHQIQLCHLNFTELNRMDAPSEYHIFAAKQILFNHLWEKDLRKQSIDKNVLINLGKFIFALPTYTVKHFKKSPPALDSLIHLQSPLLTESLAYFITGAGAAVDLNSPYVYKSYQLLQAISTAELSLKTIPSNVYYHLLSHMSANNVPRSFALLNKLWPDLGSVVVFRELLHNPDAPRYIDLLPSKYIKDSAEEFITTMYKLKNKFSLQIQKLPSHFLSILYGEAKRQHSKKITDHLLPLLVGGLSCNDIESMSNVEFIVSMSHYNRYLKMIGKDFPKNLQTCAVRKFYEYLTMKTQFVQAYILNNNNHLISYITEAEIEAVGGYVLTSLPVEYVQNSEYFIQIVKKIGKCSLPELMSAVSDEHLSQIASAYMKLQENEEFSLFSLGNLTFFLPEKILQTINTTEFKLMLEGGYLDRRICAASNKRNIISEVLKKTFGDPSEWTPHVLTTLGDMLLVVADDLQSISKTSLLFAADLISLDYDKLIEDTKPIAFYQVCACSLDGKESASYMDDLRKLVNWLLEGLRMQEDTITLPKLETTVHDRILIQNLQLFNNKEAKKLVIEDESNETEITDFTENSSSVDLSEEKSLENYFANVKIDNKTLKNFTDKGIRSLADKDESSRIQKNVKHDLHSTVVEYELIQNGDKDTKNIYNISIVPKVLKNNPGIPPINLIINIVNPFGKINSFNLTTNSTPSTTHSSTIMPEGDQSKDEEEITTVALDSFESTPQYNDVTLIAEDINETTIDWSLISEELDESTVEYNESTSTEIAENSTKLAFSRITDMWVTQENVATTDKSSEEIENNESIEINESTSTEIAENSTKLAFSRITDMWVTQENVATTDKSSEEIENNESIEINESTSTEIAENSTKLAFSRITDMWVTQENVATTDKSSEEIENNESIGINDEINESASAELVEDSTKLVYSKISDWVFGGMSDDDTTTDKSNEETENNDESTSTEIVKHRTTKRWWEIPECITTTENFQIYEENNKSTTENTYQMSTLSIDLESVKTKVESTTLSGNYHEFTLINSSKLINESKVQNQQVLNVNSKGLSENIEDNSESILINESNSTEIVENSTKLAFSRINDTWVTQENVTTPDESTEETENHESIGINHDVNSTEIIDDESIAINGSEDIHTTDMSEIKTEKESLANPNNTETLFKLELFEDETTEDPEDEEIFLSVLDFGSSNETSDELYIVNDSTDEVSLKSDNDGKFEKTTIFLDALDTVTDSQIYFESKQGGLSDSFEDAETVSKTSEHSNFTVKKLTNERRVNNQSISKEETHNDTSFENEFKENNRSKDIVKNTSKSLLRIKPLNMKSISEINKKTILKRNADTQITCNQIRLIGKIIEIVITEDFIQRISDVELQECIDIFSQLDLPVGVRDLIWNRIEKKNFHFMGKLINVSTFDTKVINMNLSNPWTLETIHVVGKYGSKSNKLRITEKLIENNQLKQPMDLETVISMGSHICSLIDLKRYLTPEIFLQSSKFLGSILTCNKQCLQKLTEIAVHKKAFGPIKQWSENDVHSLGIIMAGLNSDDLYYTFRSNYKVLGKLSVEAVQCISENHKQSFAFLTKEAINSLPLTAATVLNQTSVDTLSDQQKQYLIDYLSTPVHVEQLRPNTTNDEDSSSTDLKQHSISVIYFFVINILLMFY